MNKKIENLGFILILIAALIISMYLILFLLTVIVSSGVNILFQIVLIVSIAYLIAGAMASLVVILDNIKKKR